MDISIAKAGTYPDPSGGIAVTFSGGTVWNQGSVWDSVIQMLSADAFKVKKPTDPLYKWIEYTYSLLNTKREYQIATVLERNAVAYAPLMDAAYAADPVLAYVDGNYNGLVAKSVTGSMTYYLAIPSIMLSSLANPELTNAVSQSGNLVLSNKGNVPSTYVGNVSAALPTVTFSPLGSSNLLSSGSGIVAMAIPTVSAFDSVAASTMMGNLFSVYSGSNLISDTVSANQVVSFIRGWSETVTLSNLYGSSIGKSVGTPVVASAPVVPVACNVGEDGSSGACKDPYWTNVVYLSHFDSDFSDYKNHFLSTVWTVNISSLDEKFGPWSAKFQWDGHVKQNIPGTFWTGNFTVEFSIKPLVYNNGILWGQYNFDNGPILFLNGTGSVGYWYYDGSYTRLVSTYSSNLFDGNWHHLAFIREWGYLRVYEDGVLKSSRTIPVNQVLWTSSSYRLGEDNGWGQRLTGYMDEIRITRWIARYVNPAWFSPPVQAFPSVGP